MKHFHQVSINHEITPNKLFFFFISHVLFHCILHMACNINCLISHAKCHFMYCPPTCIFSTSVMRMYKLMWYD